MALIDLANPTRFLAFTARVLPWLAIATAPIASGSRLRNRPSRGVAITSGRQVVIQCAAALASTASSSGIVPISSRSREPSS